MAVAIVTGHAPVKTHPCTMDLFEGDPTCRFCMKEAETVQHIICGCEVLACQRYSVFGHQFVEPKDINTASVMNLCLFIRGTMLLNLC
jgi:predicted amidophosphoribosyltransferase